jgi:hypothetical protein
MKPRLALYSDQEIPANVVVNLRLLTLLGTQSPSIGYVSSAPDPSMRSLEALGLVDFHFWPHYQPGAENQPRESAFLSKAELAFACPDGAGVIVDGPRVELIGKVKAFRYGKLDA